MDHPTLQPLADQLGELDALLASLDTDDWRRPTRCDGWDIADVVLHLAQTNELATASAEQRFAGFVGAMREVPDRPLTVDEAADFRVSVERGAAPTAVFERWRTSAREMLAALAALEPNTRVTWVAGTLAARTLATTRLAETWIHTGDVAAAVNVELPASDRLREIARLAWRTLPYAFAQAGLELRGPVEFDLTGPRGEEWRFATDDAAVTIIRGPAPDLCAVAARRIDPAHTALVGTGPDADAVLALVRTYA